MVQCVDQETAEHILERARSGRGIAGDGPETPFANRGCIIPDHPMAVNLDFTGEPTLANVRRLVIPLDKITRPGGRPRKEDRRRRSGWGSDAGSSRSRKGKGGPYHSYWHGNTWDDWSDDQWSTQTAIPARRPLTTPVATTGRGRGKGSSRAAVLTPAAAEPTPALPRVKQEPTDAADLVADAISTEHISAAATGSTGPLVLAPRAREALIAVYSSEPQQQALAQQVMGGPLAEPLLRSTRLLESSR